MPTIEAQISASADDAWQCPNGGSFQVDSQRLYIASNLDDYNRGDAGLRFQAAIPQGATITAAALTIHLDVNWWNNLRAVITAEDADTSADFATNPSVITRSRTSAAVEWTALGLSAGDHDSPDLTAVVQEVVDRPGFGGVITLIVAGQTVDSHSECQFRSYDGDPSHAPLLHVEYNESGGGSASGTLAATLGGVSAAATGRSLALGSLAAGLGGLTLAATGRSQARGGLAAGLGGIALQATGTTGAQAGAHGALSATLGGVSAQAAGTVPARGGLETALGGLSLQAASTITARGALAATLSGISVNAGGNSPARGGLEAALGGLSLQAAGTAQSVATGTLAAALGGLGLQAAGSAQRVTLTAVPWQRLGALAAEARRGLLPAESRRSALPMERRMREVENAAI